MVAVGQFAHDGRIKDYVDVLVSEKYGLAFVPVPKCASTTLLSIVAKLHDVPSSVWPHTAFELIPFDAEMPRAEGKQIAIYRFTKANCEAFLQRHKDFTWFSVVRDPYERVVSIYNDKLRLYVRKFDLSQYVLAGFFKHLAFLTGRNASQAQRDALRSFLPFRNFVKGLDKNGVDWEIHYMPQTDFLRIGELKYDRILKLELLAESLPNFLEDIGVERSAIDKIARLPKYNSSIKDFARHDEDTREITRRIYQNDFIKLGYPM